MSELNKCQELLTIFPELLVAVVENKLGGWVSVIELN